MKIVHPHNSYIFIGFYLYIIIDSSTVLYVPIYSIFLCKYVLYYIIIQNWPYSVNVVILYLYILYNVGRYIWKYGLTRITLKYDEGWQKQNHEAGCFILQQLLVSGKRENKYTWNILNQVKLFLFRLTLITFILWEYIHIKL